jgi:hypothetical protein
MKNYIQKFSQSSRVIFIVGVTGLIGKKITKLYQKHHHMLLDQQ